MEIPIKAKIQCTDGPGGEATHLIVHSGTKRVTQLVVKEAQAHHIERVVPFKFVGETTSNEIRLRISRQELSKMKSFVRTDFVETSWTNDGRTPVEIRKIKRQNIADDELAVDSGTRVRATDSQAGRIDELMVEPTSGSITHLVLREGPIWAPKAVTIPIGEVIRIGEKAVYLRTDRASIEALPTTPVRRR